MLVSLPFPVSSVIESDKEKLSVFESFSDDIVDVTEVEDEFCRTCGTDLL